MTQLVVETVTTVLLLVGLRWLPKRIQEFTPGDARARIVRLYRVGDFAVAATAGSGLSALACAIMTRSWARGIADFFVEHAYTQGGGANNIVNVILVDFRAFDTFGDITVFGIVAIS